jgi:hypothetical protein
MSRCKEQRFQVAGKEREKGWQNCGSAFSWGGGGGLAESKKKERKNERMKERKKERTKERKKEKSRQTAG